MNAHPLKVPELGLAGVPIRVSVWLVATGRRVSEGERIVQLCAGDVVVDLPAPATGRLTGKRVEEDGEVAVGQLLAEITPG